MRVLFVVTGVGLGDSVRVDTIINEFRRDNPKNKFLIAAYANSYDYFKDKYPTINITGYRIPGKGMRFRVLPFLFKNIILPFAWFFTALGLKRQVKKFNPDVVVSDFEPTGVVLAKLVKKPCIMLFGFDPMMYKRFKSENKVSAIMAMQAKYLEKVYAQGKYVVIPTLLGVKRRSLIYTYINPICKSKPEGLASKRALMKSLGVKEEIILVMLGGSDFGIKLLEHLQGVARQFPKEKFIVFGTKKLTVPMSNVSHYTYKDNVDEYMKISKGVITLGGELSLSEAVAFRKPMLIYPIQDHVEQVLNAYTLKGVAMVRYNTDNFRDDVRSFLRNLKGYQAKMGELNVKPKGAEEFVRFVKTLLEP
ncbi:MAG: glycosyltransferase family protein [Candidatus Woesearchaeota archaeon]